MTKLFPEKLFLSHLFMLPLLSIIVTGRNDDYGGDFSHRLQSSVRWWSHHLQLYKIFAEYIFVNWNPLPDKPSLVDTIEWHPNKYFEVKFIEVPYAIHRQFDNPEIRKPNQLYEFIAKNAGIRRAKGKYILSTNADILCDPAFFEKVKEEGVEPDKFYRANRYDYYSTGYKGNDFEEELALIRKNIFEVKTFGRTVPFTYSKNFWWQCIKLTVKTSGWLNWQMLKFKYSRFFSLLGANIVYDNAEYQVHVNAAGDFLMMQHDHWFKLKAYDETFYLTLHNDAELVFNAAAAGLKQDVFFLPVYHQNHERRYSETNPNLQEDGYRVYKKLQEKAQRLLKNNEPEIANDDNWGLKNYDLEIKGISFV